MPWVPRSRACPSAGGRHVRNRSGVVAMNRRVGKGAPALYRLPRHASRAVPTMPRVPHRRWARAALRRRFAHPTPASATCPHHAWNDCPLRVMLIGYPRSATLPWTAMTFVHQALLTHESIRALVLRDDDETLTLLSAACSASDQFIRRSAIETVGRHPRGQELRTSILDALTDPSDYVVRAACEVVARWTWSEAHDVVASALASPSPPTREAAIRTLGAIWRETDFRPVFHIYIGDPERTVRRGAAWVLRERVTATDWLRLFEAFRTDDTPRHRVWACELAARFDGPSPSPLLATLVSDRDGHVRKAAGRAIETLARRRLEDPSWTPCST